eukprot:901702-Lingulodinium_polyedra.AAC.1
MAAILPLALQAVVAGRPSAIEHAAAPQDARRPSVWRAEELQVFVALSATGAVTFSQGPLGVVFPKPVTLLTRNLGTLRRRIIERGDPNRRPLPVAMDSQ